MKKMLKQDICPICTKSFSNGELTIQYQIFGDSHAKLAHVRCVMILATPEKKTAGRSF